MTTTTHQRPAVTTASDGFGQLLRAEWTKLRSVRRYCLVPDPRGRADAPGSPWSGRPAATTNVNEGTPLRADTFHFVHQPLAGDGSVTAHVLTQQRDRARPPGPAS